ncbi:MAG: hypothetical protein ACLFPL_03680 [Candidatus Nanoarchaeia archaeon]
MSNNLSTIEIYFTLLEKTYNSISKHTELKQLDEQQNKVVTILAEFIERKSVDNFIFPEFINKFMIYYNRLFGEFSIELKKESSEDELNEEFKVFKGDILAELQRVSKLINN